MPSLWASAEVVLPDASDRTLTVDACVGTDCVPLQLTLTNGTATCHEAAPTGQLICVVQPVDATHLGLLLEWNRRSPTVGDVVTAVVTDTTTTTILLDAAGTVATVTDAETCGTHCSQAEVVLSALP